MFCHFSPISDAVVKIGIDKRMSTTEEITIYTLKSLNGLEMFRTDELFWPGPNQTNSITLLFTLIIVYDRY